MAEAHEAGAVADPAGTLSAVNEGRYEFRTLSSRDVHVGRVMALRVDEVSMPDGRDAVREVVEHYGAVAVVALDDAGRVVLVHQYRHPLGERLWELPAGLLDVADENPVDAARRELAEEVGLAAREWSVLVDVAASPGFTDEVVRVFLASGLSPVDREPDGGEEADLQVRRIPLSHAVEMVFAGQVVNASAVAGLLAAHSVRSGAASPRPADAPWSQRPTRFAARRR